MQAQDGGALSAGTGAENPREEERGQVEPHVDEEPGAAPEAAAAPEGAEASSSLAEDPEKELARAQAASQEAQTKIFILARQQNFALALKLLELHPKLWAATDEDGHSLAHWAALVGNEDFIRKAMEAGVQVDALASNAQTPLMWAVLRGQIFACRILLDAGANIRHKDSLGATPLMIAVQHKQYRTFLLLMKRGKGNDLLVDADKNGCTSAHWAAYKGDITALKLLEYFDADLLSLDGAQMLPLHRAVCASQYAVLEFLVDKGSDPGQRNKEGKSCLDIAEANQDLNLQAVLKRIIKKRASALGKAGNKVDIESGKSMFVQEPSAINSDAGEEKRKSLTWKETLMTTFQDQTMHKAFPVFWLICVSLAVFEYLMDLRALGYAVAPTASLLFELGVPLSLGIFAWVALSDPGKVPSPIKGNTGVEELMRAFDSDNCEEEYPGLMGSGVLRADLDRLCTTTWVLKGLRQKYCKETGACVEEFDHYCIWLNCAIGKKNHPPFVLLALVEFLTQVTHLYLCGYLARNLVIYQSFGGWVLGVLAGYPLLSLMAVAHSLTAPWVCMLMLHQCRLIAMNLTTNEMMNAQRYKHFWVFTGIPGMPGAQQKGFRNPFNKGSMLNNFLDFWVYRRRSALNASAPVTGGAGGGGGHSHSHGHGGGGHGGGGQGHGHSHGDGQVCKHAH